MLELFREIADSGERLRQVRLLAHRDLPDMLARVCFDFGFRHLTGEVDPEDDTIVIAEPGCEDPGSDWITLNADARRHLKGSRLLWAWTLTNQQGYTDGLQLELSSGEGRSIVIQLLAMASGLAVYRMTPADTA